MDLGPQELIIIVLLLVILFGIAWAAKNKRYLMKRPNANNASSNKDSSKQV